jgi:hypothetical protein
MFSPFCEIWYYFSAYNKKRLASREDNVVPGAIGPLVLIKQQSTI